MKRTIEALASTLLVAAACFVVAPAAWAADVQAYVLSGDEPVSISVPASNDSDDEGDQALASSKIALASAPAGVSLQPGDNVWVNGSTGDDANPGTEEYPVKTFSRAKELMDKFNSDIIWVTGALQVSGTTETWDLGGKMVMRDGAYRGTLVEVTNKGSLTLRNLVIDGGCKNGATGKADSGDGSGGSLITVRGSESTKSTLTICDGTILRNNVVAVTNHSMPESGGAIYGIYANVNVEGGSITGNSAVYGGGVCIVDDSLLTMSGGSITGNSAVKARNSGEGAGYSGTGGGVLVWRGAAMNFSGGAISENVAYNRGGGISVGGVMTYAPDSSSVLTMTGGTISNNKAGSAGGGIFVASGTNPDAGYAGSYCVAKISGGSITNNQMTGDGDSNKAFGGGAIYVNGISSDYNMFHNGELYLERVEVSDNSAAIAGGGYAGCPSSLTEVNLTNGAVFYGNKTDTGKAREIYVLASSVYGSHSGDPHYEVSPSMLGGAAYRWVYDDGAEVPLSELSGALSAARGEELCLSNALGASSAGVQRAVSLTKVHITGNTSTTRGGGIGSNGSVFIGKVDEETTEVSASKNWVDADDKDGIRPGSVTFELYRNGEYVGYQTVSPNDNGVWETTFTDLPKVDADGHEYVYTVKERAVEGYVGDVEGDAAEGFSVFNTRVTSVDVSKKWDDGDNIDGKRPASVTVDLLRDGEKIDSATIEADDNGHWGYTFSDLAKYDSEDSHEYVYTVEERAVEGYISKVAGSAADGFIITNVHEPATTSVEVTKKWVGTAAKSATVKLQVSDDGGAIWTDIEGATVELTEASGWKATFENLPAYVTGKQGVRRLYRVVEESIEDFTATYEVEGEKSDGSFEAKDGKIVKVVVTNTKNEIPPTPETSENSKKELAQTGDSTFGLFATALVAGVAALACGVGIRRRTR